ncbi:MAG: hypothetical protein E7646_05170 [Ruminococcaceae bacterium]|nr:hypothetical protein [Oscillospiraceae bacterium]
MKKTKIVFSFDTEDLVHEGGADGILYCVKALDEVGIKGCFNIVGLLADKLKKWGRQDVIDGLKNHELDLHSLDHSFHPAINEYTDTEDFDMALNEFLKRESLAIEKIDRVFGKAPHVAACPPGVNVSYVAHYGYEKLGCKVYCGDQIYDWVCGSPFHFCNLLTTEYDLCFDWYLLQDLSEDDMKAKLDEIVASGKALYTFCHHPDRGIYDEHWDLLNFVGKNTPEGEYRFANRYSDEQIEAFYKRMKRLMELVRDDERFEIVTYQDLADEYCSEKRVISRDMLPDIKSQLEEKIFPLTSPDSLSLCDIFLACRALLLGEKEFICGSSRGFLGEPFKMRKPNVFTKEQMVKSAETIYDEGFLPEFIYIDGVKIGPADWMMGALEILCGADKVRITPQQWQIDLWRIKAFRALPQALLSSMGSERFNHLYEKAALQTWTIRFPKGHDRMYK